MNESQERFCQRLMAADPATPEFKAKYEKEKQMLFSDRKIEGMLKRRLMVTTILALTVGMTAAVFAAFGGKLFTETALERWLLAVMAVFTLAMGFYLVRILMRGKVNLGTYCSPLENLNWIMTVILFGILAFNSFAGSAGGLQLLGFGLGILIFGGVHKIGRDMKRADLRTREELLRLECQFADLTEKLQPRRD